MISKTRLRILHLLAALLLASPLARAQNAEPTVTPYRPSVANPAELPEPGWLELEMGWQRQQGGSDSRRDSLPLTAKLAFSENWGVLLGTELGLRRTGTDGTQYSGTGDTTLIVKHLLGGSYNLNKRTVLDFGMARGLTAATPEWSAFFGVSVLSARLW